LKSRGISTGFGRRCLQICKIPGIKIPGIMAQTPAVAQMPGHFKAGKNKAAVRELLAPPSDLVI
jgi:hypothetical protein